MVKVIRSIYFSIFALLAPFVSGCALSPSEQSGHPIDDNELLVLDPPADYLRHLPDLGIEVIDVTDLPGVGSKLYHMRVTDDAHPFDARDRHLGKFPDVIVDAHHHYEHHAAKIDKSYTARKAANWASLKSSCSNGLRIGVIDGVVQVNHPAFRNTKITYRSFHLKGQKLANSGHGTAVTAVIVGQGEWGGLLPKAEITAANVFHIDKNGKTVGSAKSIVRAIDWMILNKVPVVNISIGGGPNALISKAIEHANSRGIILIGSAGNTGPFSKKKNYPGAYPPVIAITAINRFERSASFASSGDYIEFAAPGVDIWTAFPGGGKPMSGTSFSAPIVTSFAAVALKHLNLKTVDDLRAYFKKHTRDHSNPGRDRFTGWGILQPPPNC